MNYQSKIRQFVHRDDQNPCPYGTYQRATGHLPVRSLTPRLIVRLIRAKFNDETRRNRAKAPARKLVYCGALAHWRTEMDMVDRYRF